MHQFVPLEKMLARINKRSKLARNVTPKEAKISFPIITSVKNKVLTIYDQGQLGSCTSNAFCGAYLILENIKNGAVLFEPSRLFLYFYERLIEDPTHNINDLTDSGADVIDGESYVLASGICSETSWPYIISQYNVRPPLTCNIEATSHKIAEYHTIPLDANLINNIKLSLNNQTPVLIALQAFESFESLYTEQTGVVTMPAPTEQSLGGHEMVIVGYTDNVKLFTVLNSWSNTWGKQGFCYMPYAYITNPNLGLEFTVFTL